MGHTSSWTHHVTLPGEALSVLRARRFVCFHLAEHRLLYLLEDVRLVTSELAANAVRHAQTSFTVTLQQIDKAQPDNGYVLLTVHDGSPSPPVHMTSGVLDTSGRGVSIIDLVSQDWGVTHETGGGKSVWASFVLR